MQRNRGKQQNGKIRYLFKKSNISCKDGHDKGRNIKDIIEAEEIKTRWQEYTELFEKGHNDLNNHEDVVTHLEPDILECEVKWALRNIAMSKASGDDGIPAELFKT